jgi:hypothetical protein
LAQDRANRSKKDKVIYRQIDMFEPTRLLPAWAISQEIPPRSVRTPGLLSVSARTTMAPLRPQKLGTSK